MCSNKLNKQAIAWVYDVKYKYQKGNNKQIQHLLVIYQNKTMKQNTERSFWNPFLSLSSALSRLLHSRLYSRERKLRGGHEIKHRARPSRDTCATPVRPSSLRRFSTQKKTCPAAMENGHRAPPHGHRVCFFFSAHLQWSTATVNPKKNKWCLTADLLHNHRDPATRSFTAESIITMT